VREFVNLPADGDALDLDGAGAEEAVKPERIVRGDRGEGTESEWRFQISDSRIQIAEGWFKAGARGEEKTAGREYS
jgi:hypothetical protein